MHLTDDDSTAILMILGLGNILMRLVLLTQLDMESDHRFVAHRYVANVLAEAFHDDLKAVIITDNTPAPLPKRLKRYWRRYTFSQLLSRVLIKARYRLQRQHEKQLATYKRVLFPTGENARTLRPDLIRIVPSHNGKACLDILHTLKPDIIAVYGTQVLKADIIAAAGISILNMHTGLSPRYRGADTIFWPLHNNEPEWVGVTIHRLTPGIDAGPILATAKPAISADDDEDVLFAKSVKVGCEYLKRAIYDEYNGSANVTPQQLENGREYKSVERTVSAERRVERLLRAGLLAKYPKQR